MAKKGIIPQGKGNQDETKIKDKEVVRNKKMEKHTDHQLGKGRKGIKDKLANLSLSPSK